MKQPRFAALVRTMMLGAVLMIGVVTGVVLDRQVLTVYAAPDGIPADAEGAFGLMAEAWNLIDQVYVDRSAVDTTRLAYGAISGMVEALGDTGHSRFMSPETRESHRQSQSGSFEGIGAYVEEKDGLVIIVSPIDGSPAQAAGLEPGDAIVAVDGEDVTGLPLSDVIARVIGPAGSEVLLTVLKADNGEIVTLNLTRASIALQYVTAQMVPGTTVGHVRIASFGQDTAADLEEALEALQDEGATAIVLDLRNNPGGLLREAIGVASQFLPAGEAVVLRQNASGDVQAVEATGGGAALDLELVVLINEGSASASEIVSGALQDHERATLVGVTTFGTGTVLNEFGLSDGSAILLATEQWLTPEGRVIWHQGVVPDVPVALADDAVPLWPSPARPVTAEELAGSDDAQLRQALELLGAIEPARARYDWRGFWYDGSE